MPDTKPMFLPIMEDSRSGAVNLPGLMGSPHPDNAALFPIGTYPIMASGQYVGTLFPLMDPIQPQPMPMPPEVSSVAMPNGVTASGIPPVMLEPPMPQEVLSLPPQTAPDPSSSPALAPPLPTAVSPVLQAFPPWQQPIPEVPNYPPQQLPMPVVDNPGPLPGGNLQADPIAVQQTSGMSSLVQAVQSLLEQQQQGQQQAADRNTIRAGIPEPNTGQVLWEQSWGNG
jgi:hypothetical protein